MDLESKAEHIRDMLGTYAPEEQRRLLQELLDSAPVHEGTSIENAADYVHIFRHLLFSAFFPHEGNPTPPWNIGITSRALAWDWIFAQIQDEMAQDTWMHRACVPQIQECARQALVTWAERDYPLRISPRMLEQFGVALSTLSSLCMRVRGWDFPPPPLCADLARDYIAAFHLNWADVEKRRARQLIKLGAQDTETIIGKNGVALEPPPRPSLGPRFHQFPPNCLDVAHECGVA